jgi:uncharacterized spore protein YtfJ
VAKDRPKDPRTPKPPKPRKPPKPLTIPEAEPLATAPATAVERPASRAPASRLDELVDLFGRSRLTYGDPVQASGRTVIPVSRVRLSGGLGFGRGGGHLDAQPVGFIDVGPDGSRFVEIADPDRLARNVKAGAAALTAVLTGLAGARRLGAGRRRPARRQLRS